MSKAQFRSEIRQLLKELPAAERQDGSRRASERLVARPEIQASTRVLLYLALPYELDVRAALDWFIGQGKIVAVPRFCSTSGEYEAASIASVEQLVPGQFGILEPPPSAPVLPLNSLDLILVPGLAFDPAGRRLGRGKGYYDRLLARARGVKCGVCFDFQVLEELPAEPHDINMDFILTPTRWLAPGPKV